MLTQRVTVYETPTGFLWAEMGLYYKTFALARRAILRDAKKIADSVGKVATVIEVY